MSLCIKFSAPTKILIGEDGKIIIDMFKNACRCTNTEVLQINHSDINEMECSAKVGNNTDLDNLRGTFKTLVKNHLMDDWDGKTPPVIPAVEVVLENDGAVPHMRICYDFDPSVA